MQTDINYLQEAHKIFRRIQVKYGHAFTPRYTKFVGNAYQEALGKDTNGQQAYNFAKDLEEQCALMPTKPNGR